MISVIVLAMIAWWSYFLFARIQAVSHPAFLFSIYWFIILAAAKIFSGPELSIDSAAIYIFAAVLAFSSPAILVKKVEMPSGNHIVSRPVLLTVMFTVLQVAIIIGIILHIQAQGLSISAALKAPDKFGGDFISLRYSGKVVSTYYIQIATTLNFVCVAVCGLIVANDRRYLVPILLTISTFIPSIAAMFLFGDKGTLPQSIAFYCGGLFVGWISAGNTTFMSKRAVVFFSIGLCVLVPIIIIAMIIKIVGKFQAPNALIVEYLQYYFRSYAVGSIYAFSDWLNWYAGQQSVMVYTEQNKTVGAFTFWGIAKYLPTGYQMPVGYYLEYFEVQGVIKTNIYTAFRGLITDFGLFGSLIFLSLTGCTSTAAYQTIAKKTFAPLSQTFYIMLVGAIYASSLISLCTWTSPFVAAALLFLIIYVTSLSTAIVRSMNSHLTKN